MIFLRRSTSTLPHGSPVLVWSGSRLVRTLRQVSLDAFTPSDWDWDWATRRPLTVPWLEFRSGEGLHPPNKSTRTKKEHCLPPVPVPSLFGIGRYIGVFRPRRGRHVEKDVAGAYVAYNKHRATMKSAMRNLLTLAIFLGVLTLITGSRSRSLGLVLGLGFYGIASTIILIRTYRRKAGDSYLRQGWGNPLAVFPATWQHWLYGGRDQQRSRIR